MNIYNIKHKYRYFIILLFILPISFVNGQLGVAGVPSTYNVFDITGDGVENGDIISFNRGLNIYQQSETDEDERIFGVVNEEPVIVFRVTGNDFPIIQNGEVMVNVTTLNGDISIGDEITTSLISGKGKKFSGGKGFVLGTALEPLNNELSDNTIIYDGKEIVTGKILVLLSIGPSVDAVSESLISSTIFLKNEGEVETGIETAFRYMTAAIFTVGTLIIVFKTFGPNMGKGIVSVGRNPLAKNSIQAMVIFNFVLIISISLIGFIVSLLIIFLPL